MSIPESLFAECAKCSRGAEACQWCEHVGMSEDWQTICDCGLYDFGSHLFDCESRAAFKYVVANDYDAAKLPRVAELEREANK